MPDVTGTTDYTRSKSLFDKKYNIVMDLLVTGDVLISILTVPNPITEYTLTSFPNSCNYGDSRLSEMYRSI